MTTNEELLRKADLALSDLASGGLLNPEQSNRFLRKMIEQPTILSSARFVPMGGPSREINKIGFGTRILRAANQGAISGPNAGDDGTRALSRAQRATPTLNKITLNTKEVIAEINLPYEVLEDNIEKDNLQNTLVDMIAERAALDLEELVLLGDTTTVGDDYLALVDGVIKQSVSNTVNHLGAGMNPALFGNMIKALPTQYHRLLDQFRFYVSRTREVDYRTLIAQRQTGLGDATLTGRSPMAVLGVQMQGAGLMPNANALLTIPQNLIVGVQRQMRMEFDRDIRERAYVIVLTMRLDTKFEEEDMVVKAENIGA